MDRDSRGGGVLLAINVSIPSMQIQSPTNLEIIAVKLFGPTTIITCVVYAPPNAGLNYYDQVTQYLHSITNNEKVLIVGDFNLPDINWASMTSSSESSSKFCDYVFEDNLTQLVFNPTHNKGNTLDLVLTNMEDQVSDLSVRTSLHEPPIDI